MKQKDAATADGKIFFIDDTQISSMEGVKRQLHPARKHEGNPLVTSDKDWEAPEILIGTVRKEGNQYRMWYQSQAPCPGANKVDSYRRFLHLYAESEDGISWTKPAIGIYEDSMGSYENNIAFVRLDLTKDMNPNVLYTPNFDHGRAYTMMTYGSGHDVPYSGYVLAYSDDGIKWTDGPKTPVIPGYGDIGWFTYDEEDGILRGTVTWDRVPGPACTQSPDGHEWALPWTALLPDQEDNKWAEDNPSSSTVFHGMPVFRHGPVFLGFLQVLRGHEVPGQGLDGKMDVQLVCSRNGRDWERVDDRRPILELGEEGSWDSGLLWTGNSLLADGDRMIVYYSGCEKSPGALGKSSWPKSIGMAWWPKDRFVGLASTREGVVVTEPLGNGRQLHINANASSGRITAELLHEDGSAVDGFESGNCVPLAGQDSLDHQFRWQNADLPSVENGQEKAIRLRMYDAEVFSVWWE